MAKGHFAKSESQAASVMKEIQGKLTPEELALGKTRDDKKKETPCLIPYAELPESEKEYDRSTAIQALKLIVKLGYQIKKENRNGLV